jgi:hypothetical protein
MSKEIMQQCLDLITELDKDGVVYELGLILELRNALGIPDKLKMKAELAKPEQNAGKCGCGANLYIDENGKPCSKAQPEHPLDKKADNARELGLDYEVEPEPFEYWNAVEGWVKIDEIRKHFDSVGCGTIYKTGGEGRKPLYTAPPKYCPSENNAAYEKGFVEGMTKQAQSSVDRAVNEMGKPWIGMTDEEIHDFDKKLRDNGDYCSLHFAWGISAKLKEKNE